MIRVLIADDHHIVRAGIQAVLDDAEDVTLVGIAENGTQAISLALELAPDVILMDLSMTPTNGIEAARQILSVNPEIAVVALTANREHHRVLASLDAGMMGYLVKDAPPDDILRAVRDASVGSTYLDSVAARALVRSRTSSVELTSRESEILELVGLGLTNRQISTRLGIADRTVKNHLTKVFATIGVSDRASAGKWMRERNSKIGENYP